nr:AEL_HP1_G0051720.mRNA.1.CDS.1 [Saccharomyces cerevisiae]
MNDDDFLSKKRKQEGPDLKILEPPALESSPVTGDNSPSEDFMDIQNHVQRGKTSVKSARTSTRAVVAVVVVVEGEDVDEGRPPKARNGLDYVRTPAAATSPIDIRESC